MDVSRYLDDLAVAATLRSGRAAAGRLTAEPRGEALGSKAGELAAVAPLDVVRLRALTRLELTHDQTAEPGARGRNHRQRVRLGWS